MELEEVTFDGPFDFVARKWVATIRKEPVVYRLRIVDRVAGTFRSIARAGGIDTAGVLDIGESENGHRRLDDFCCAAIGKLRSHRAGWEYSLRGYDFTTIFPPADLQIEFFHVSSKPLAEAIELALLERYRWSFKDRPPLNGSDGKYKKVEAWLRSLGRTPRDSFGDIDLSGLI